VPDLVRKDSVAPGAPESGPFLDGLDQRRG